MHYKIQKHMYDILEADPRLLQSGPALGPLTGDDYEPAVNEGPAFAGTIRPTKGENPLEGYVHLFEHVWDRKPSKHRPAIYTGMFKKEPFTQAGPDVINGLGIRYKKEVFPFTIVAHGESHDLALRRRDQLAANFMKIVSDLQYVKQAGFWYNLKVNNRETDTWTTSSGGGDDGLVTSSITIPVEVETSFNPGDQNDA